MKNPPLARSGIAALTAALAATGLTSTPAGAAVDNAQAYVELYFSDNDSDCTRVGATTGADSATWTDDGGAVSRTFSRTGLHRRDTSPTDIVDVSASGAVTVSATPVTGVPATIRINASASSSAVPRLTTTQCAESAEVTAAASGTLTLPRPMWVTLTAVGDGSGSGGLWFESEDGEGGIQVRSRNTATSTFLASAGELEVSAGSLAWAHSTEIGGRHRSSTYAGTYTFDFQPLGAGAPAIGRGRAFTVFGTRDCATGAVAAEVTRKAKRKARSVRISVNGRQVVRLKGRKLKKRSLTLPAAPSSRAEVVATIKLENGRKVTVTRSYLPCS